MMDTAWLSMKKIPFDAYHFSKPCLINEKEMVVLGVDGPCHRYPGPTFMKYNFAEDKYQSWQEMNYGLKHDQSFFDISFSLTVNNCIYHQTSKGTLMVNNMKTSKCNKYPILTDKTTTSYYFGEATY